jgi:hypothetical protein
MGVVDRLLTTFDSDISHGQASFMLTLRGSAVS